MSSFFTWALSALSGTFSSGPTRENETARDIRRYHEYEARHAAEDRERELYAAKLEESRRRLQVMEADMKWQEVEVEHARARAAALERTRVQAEQKAAAESARAAEAERIWGEAEIERAARLRANQRAVLVKRKKTRAEQDAAAGSARAASAERKGQTGSEVLGTRATAAREAAANHDRMRREREAAEERAKLKADYQKAIAEKKATEEETRRREEQARRKEEEARQKEEEARRKEEDARSALRKLEMETRELTGKLRQLEKTAKEQKEAKEKRDKEQEVGAFGPLRWPTRDEFQDAMQRIKYDRNNFHFAIVGKSGSGKSSLINAFRNLHNREPGAAKAGITETTLDIGRYPDPGTAPPRKWIVWYDIPGAGTQRIPSHDYFVQQGLFVFDLVILAIGDRFEEIDVRIVEDCARFRIPTFIVRSKADMHINNSMGDYGNYNPAVYAQCRDEFIHETQRTVSEGLARQKLPDQEVYIVSRDVLKRTYNGALQHLNLPDWAQPDTEVIHERHLCKQLITAAAGRRCEVSSGGAEAGAAAGGEGFGAQKRVERSLGRVQRSVIDALNQVRDTTRHAVGEPVEGNGSGVVRAEPAPSNPAVHLNVNLPRNPTPPPTPTLARKNRRARAADERKPVEQANAAKEKPKNVLKVIYTRKPVESAELFAEMVRNHPDMENMLVCKPRMFTERVFLLTFQSLATIPHEVTAFGGTLRIKEYEDRRKKGVEKKEGEEQKGRGEERKGGRERKGGGEKEGGKERKGGGEKEGGKEQKGGAVAAAGQNQASILPTFGASNLPTFGDGVPESGGNIDSSVSGRNINANRDRRRRGRGRGGY